MGWKKASPEMSALLGQRLSGFACDKRVMFGGPAYFAGGNMFSAVHQSDIVLRLSEKDRG